MPELKIYVTHSGNSENPETNEYDEFYNLKPSNQNSKINAILLNVNKISEGCDIDFVDVGLFLDPVKDRNIVKFYQNVGRICRKDKFNKKTHATIIYTFIKNDKKDVAKQIINYFEMIMQLTEKNDDYYKKFKELFDNLKNNENEIKIVIDNKKEHDCILHLNQKIKNWDDVKKEVGKIIADRADKFKNFEKYQELSILKKYDFTKSKPQKCIFEGDVKKKRYYASICNLIYEKINNAEQIISHTTINIKTGKYIEHGFKHNYNLNISLQGVDSNTVIREICNICYIFDYNIEIETILKNKQFVVIKCNNKNITIETLE